MKILITGANGQLGLELQAQLGQKADKYQVIPTDYASLDITNFKQVKAELLLKKPI